MAKSDTKAPSVASAKKTLFAALTALKENGGQLTKREVVAEVEKRVELTDWDKSHYENTSHPRWRSVMHFYSINCVKAGYLLRKKGIWYLTPEGEAALKLGPDGLYDSIKAKYREWRAANPRQIKDHTAEVETADEEAVEQEFDLTLDTLESKAIEGIESYINKMNPYEFQDLCAALLRGMGYYTPFVSPKGRDGGIDIIAYRDPLGTVAPRIKVQVKHREATAGNGDINQLRGLLTNSDEVGIFISSGGFSSDARNAARNAAKHIELINLDRFIELWQEFYEKMTDEDKRLLPLSPVYFLSLEE